jgi:hypothetical protein
MDPKYEQFLRQAQACMTEADRARVAQVRQGWLQLAARWLDMIPPDGVEAQRDFESSVPDLDGRYRSKQVRN